ncbi:MAG: 3'-5' exonuclease [Spirochaetota bacterium]|nr:3'-5' exonuclease [Spirochaetota bacterium]
MEEFNSNDDIDISRITWIAVDTETTGINPWEYELIEIGAVKFNLTSVIDRFQVIIKPEKKQDPKSRAIHKISETEILDKGVSLSKALKDFYCFIGSDPLIFHNASFDLAFLVLSSQKENLALSNNYYYDTLYLLKTYKPELESYSLEFLKSYLNLEGPSHRALADAENTAYIFQWIISENHSKVNSRKKMKSFFRYHRKIKSFQVLLPRNLDAIFSYFSKFIQTRSVLRISDEHISNKHLEKNTKNVIPIDIMIFNQKLLLKCSIYPQNYVALIPLANATIFDQDRGPLKIADI